MRVSTAVRHNLKGLDILEKTLDKLDKVEIATGVFRDAGKHPEAGIHTAALLAMHEKADEFGIDHLYPPRPVMKISTQEHGKDWGEAVSEDISDLLHHVGLKKVPTYSQIMNYVENAAEMMAEDVRDEFGDSSIMYPNAESTIEQKGFDAPLVESGHLRKSIKSKVRRTK